MTKTQIYFFITAVGQFSTVMNNWQPVAHLCKLKESTRLRVVLSLCSLSLIEPGPVHTEFEAKMIQDVKQKEYPGTDPDTLHYFKNVYLPSSVDIFETLGQTPDDIARVSLQPHTVLSVRPLL